MYDTCLKCLISKQSFNNKQLFEQEQCAEDFSLLQQACDEQSAALAETKVELQLRKEELITVGIDHTIIMA